MPIQQNPSENHSPALSKLKQWFSPKHEQVHYVAPVPSDPNPLGTNHTTYNATVAGVPLTSTQPRGNKEQAYEEGVLTLLRNISKDTFNYVNPNKEKKALPKELPVTKPVLSKLFVAPDVVTAASSNDLWLETEQLLKVGSWKYDVEAKKFECTANTFNLLAIPDKTNITAFTELLAYFNKGDKEQITACWERALLRKEESKVVGRLQHNAEAKWVEIKFKPVAAGNKLLKLIGTFADVTDTIKKENDLLLEKNKAEMMNETKTAFMSLYSHEIRTPLNSIVGFTYLLLQETNLPAKIKKYLNSIHFSAQHLLYLSKNTLDHSKIEAGRLELEVVNFKLRDLLNSLYQSFCARAKAKQISFELIIDPCVPEEVTGDPVRLTQALNNLIGNAIKFTKEGSVRLVVDVIYQSDNDWVLDFAVEDTGIGIPEESQKLVFDSYVQASVSTHRSYGGTGLGLSITKKIVELHKGEIKLESTPGVGSVFTVRLKYTKAKPVYPALPAKPGNRNSYLENVRVLVIDDDEINNLVTNELLLQWGATVDTAEDGQKALWKINSNKYDLILMDLYMPTMDGFDTIAHIRNSGIQVPVIALTCTANQEEICQLLALGVTDYLIKPFHPNQLFTKLTQLNLEPNC